MSERKKQRLAHGHPRGDDDGHSLMIDALVIFQKHGGAFLPRKDSDHLKYRVCKSLYTASKDIPPVYWPTEIEFKTKVVPDREEPTLAFAGKEGKNDFVLVAGSLPNGEVHLDVFHKAKGKVETKILTPLVDIKNKGKESLKVGEVCLTPGGRFLMVSFVRSSTSILMYEVRLNEQGNEVGVTLGEPTELQGPDAQFYESFSLKESPALTSETLACVFRPLIKSKEGKKKEEEEGVPDTLFVWHLESKTLVGSHTFEYSKGTSHSVSFVNGADLLVGTWDGRKLEKMEAWTGSSPVKPSEFGEQLFELTLPAPRQIKDIRGFCPNNPGPLLAARRSVDPWNSGSMDDSMTAIQMFRVVIDVEKRSGKVHVGDVTSGMPLPSSFWDIEMLWHPDKKHIVAMKMAIEDIPVPIFEIFRVIDKGFFIPLQYGNYEKQSHPALLVENAQGLTSEQFAYAGDTMFSADGSTMAFIRRDYDDEGEDFRVDILSY